ncbi:MAG: S-methyl-5-thioribose-1-phosphate isomerase [Candidatus Bathyarchaeota archaeon]|nr:S-methyl-5-thioribose-1-phosphate isomerase [Candidatus Bathyarchaeota archaeon]
MRTIEWQNGTVVTVDQSKLPSETVTITLKNCEEVADAIRNMKIRGAPLLGAAAAFALALTAHSSEAESRERLLAELEKSAEIIRATRPTAVNLFWAIDRILSRAKDFSGSSRELAAFVVNEAQKVADEDVAVNRLLGKHGADLIRDGDVVLTHCNAGALATVDYGTALGVIRAAWEAGKRIRVFATETRPQLQGARLTAYELRQAGIPVTLITDSMVGYVMSKRLVNKVIVGADRVVQDAVINKIGTFTIAVLAREHSIPFFVAAPTSTFDLTNRSDSVIIEQRKSEEVTHVGSIRIATKSVDVLNPAFDVTPLKYVTAVICEQGILYKGDLGKFKSSIPTRE